VGQQQQQQQQQADCLWLWLSSWEGGAWSLAGHCLPPRGPLARQAGQGWGRGAAPHPPQPPLLGGGQHWGQGLGLLSLMLMLMLLWWQRPVQRSRC
jgi:hypothetical protein